MQHSESQEQFVRRLTEHQNRIYGYIFSLLGDHSRASDVLQETNLVLWRRLDEFQPDRPFLPWALAIARLQVLAHLRDHKRDRLLLDAELVETIGREAEHAAQQFDAIREALRHCLELLTPRNRDLVERRYYRGVPLAEIAQTVGRTVGAIKSALLRIRRELAECVKRRLAADV